MLFCIILNHQREHILILGSGFRLLLSLLHGCSLIFSFPGKKQGKGLANILADVEDFDDDSLVSTKLVRSCQVGKTQTNPPLGKWRALGQTGRK